VTSSVVFDRELRPSYQLSLTCWDLADQESSRLTSHALIPVRVVDQNDVTPSFRRRRYDATVAENNRVGHAILQVR